MIAFAARRLGAAAVTAWVASVVVFVLFWSVPNVDPSYWLGGAEKGTNETRARAVEQYGLDHPLPVQYVRLMEGIVTGDVECFYNCGSLRQAFVDALPVTASLVGGAALIAATRPPVGARDHRRGHDGLLGALDRAGVALLGVPGLQVEHLPDRLRAAHREPARLGVAPGPAVGGGSAAVRRSVRPLRARIASHGGRRGLGPHRTREGAVRAGCGPAPHPAKRADPAGEPLGPRLRARLRGGSPCTSR